MKIKIILISIFLFLGSIVHAQNKDYGIVYVNRLKKSTASYIDYKVWVGDKFIGTLYGTSPVFTYKYYGAWMVFAVDVKNNVPIKITEGKNNVLRALLILNIKKNGKYFLTFNSAAEYKQNPFKLIDEKEGLLALNKSKSSDINIINNWIRPIVLKDKEKGIEATKYNIDYEKDENVEIQQTSSNSILVKNNKEGMLNNFLDAIKNKKAETYLKEGKFDLFKSYYYDPKKDINLLDDIKASLKDINEHDSVIIYYSEKDKRIYVAVNYSK